MTVQISNTSLNNSFNSWRLNTNYMATVISNNAVTVRGTGDRSRGGMNRGDGHIEGTFSANTFKTFELAGGNTVSDTNLSIISNTSITGSELTVSANATFTGNVDFNISGTDRLHLGGVDRMRISGGSRGQFMRIETTTGDGNNPSIDTPQFKFLTMRDITDLSVNSAHIILSSSNTNFSEDTNSPHLVFACGTGGSNPSDAIHIFGAGDATTGSDSDLWVKLADSVGDSKFTVAGYNNNAVATIASDGKIDTTAGLNVAGRTTLGELYANDAVQFFDSARFDGVSVFHDEVTFNSTVNLFGDVNVGDAAADQLNVEASSYLHGNTTLGDANTDTLSVNAEVITDVVPAADQTYTLGKEDKRWNKVWMVTGEFVNLTVDGTSALNETTTTNLTANGAAALNGVTATTLTANGAVYGKSTLRIDGNATFNSDVTLGNSNTDYVVINSEVNSDIVPAANGSYSLGSSHKQWDDLWVTRANTETLTVDGNSKLNGTTVTTLTANGAADLKSSLNVDGDTTLNGVTATTLTANSAATIKGNLTVEGSRTSITQRLNVSDRTTLVDLHANSNIDVDGTSSFHGTTTTTLHANGNFSVDGDSAVNGLTTTTLHANGNFSVDGDSAVNGLTATTLHANGNVTVDGDSAVNGLTATTVHANGNVTVDGSSSLNGTTTTTLTSNGAVAFKSTLDVDAATRLKSGVILGDVSTDSITVKGSFANQSTYGLAVFNGYTNFNNNLYVNANSTIGATDSDIVTYNALIGSNFVPATDVTYDLGTSSKKWKDLYLSGSSIYLGSIQLTENNGRFNVADLEVTGGSYFNGVTATTFTANLASTFSNTVNVVGESNLWKVNASANVALSDRLDVSGNVSFTGVTTLADTTVTGQLNVSENTYISGNLYVAGTTTTINTEELNLADNIIVLNSNLGSGIAPTENSGITVNRGSDTDVSLLWNETDDQWVIGKTNLTGDVKIDGNFAMQGGTDYDVGADYSGINPGTGVLYTETEKHTLWQNGDIQTFNVYANTVFHDKVAISAPIVSTGPGTFSKLNISGESALGGKVTISDDLNVTGRSTLTELYANAAVDFANTFAVVGPSTLWKVQATANVVFSDRLDVSGNTSLSKLDVSAASTLTTLNVTGAVDFDSTLNVDGETTLAGDVAADITPKKTAGARGPNLGSSSKNWDIVYANNIVVAANTTIANELNVTGLIKSESGLLTSPEVLNATNTQTSLDLLDSDSFHITLKNNTTLVLSNIGDKVGGYGSIILIQDSTGGWEVTWPSEFKTPRGATIAQETGAGTMALLSYYVVDANTILVNYLGDFQ